MATDIQITCGNCHLKHASIADVKSCYGGVNSAIVGDLPIDVGEPQVLFGKTLPATDAQMDFIRKLADERGLSVVQTFTTEQASAEINRLKQIPRQPKPIIEPESGMYRNPDTGEILKVYRAVHGSGRMCAKRLVVETEMSVDFQHSEVRVPGQVHFDYLGLATRFIKGHIRMTLEDARKFGAIYGVCCVCARTLTDEQSISRGIGPVCERRL